MDTTRIMNPSPAVDCPELEFEMIIAQIEAIHDYARFLEDSTFDDFMFLVETSDDIHADMEKLDSLIEEMESLLYKEPEAEDKDEEDYSWNYVTSEYRHVPADFRLTCPSCGKSYDIRDNGFRPMLCDRPIPINNDTYLETFRFAFDEDLYYADGSARARPVSIRKCPCGCLTCTTPVFNSNAENMTEYVQLFIMDKVSDDLYFGHVIAHPGIQYPVSIDYNRIRGLDKLTLKCFMADYIGIPTDSIWHVDFR